MSPRLRRQEARKVVGLKYKPYANAVDDDDEFKPSPRKRRSDSCVPVLRKTSLENKKLKATTSDPLPPPSMNLGMPTREQYKTIEEEYIQSLHPRKREKALLCQAMFDMVWDVLHDPLRSRIGSPQFRWWVRKMFVLSNARSELSVPDADGAESPAIDPGTPVVLHENRPVALKEQIYEVLCYCHDLCNHGGRDKTTMVIREHYSWVPKELVAQFVKVCPTCIYKKTGSKTLAQALNDSPLLPMHDDSTTLDDAGDFKQERLGTYDEVPVLSEPSHALNTVKAELSAWSAAYLPHNYQPLPIPTNTPLTAPVDAWMPDSVAQDGWSTSSNRLSAPESSRHPQSRPGYLRGYTDLAPIHRSEDAFSYSSSRVTLPPLQQVLSDGAYDYDSSNSSNGSGLTWGDAPSISAWGSVSSTWGTGPSAHRTNIGFTFQTPTTSPRKLNSAQGEHIYGYAIEADASSLQRAPQIDPVLLLEEQLPSVNNSPFRPEQEFPTGQDMSTADWINTPGRVQCTLSVQSLIVGSASITSLSLGEQTTPRRLLPLDDGRSPGGSMYLHPSKLTLGVRPFTRADLGESASGQSIAVQA